MERMNKNPQGWFGWADLRTCAVQVGIILLIMFVMGVIIYIGLRSKYG